MTYDGNRLIKVDDSAQLVTTTGTFDFSDGCDESVEYLYDGCGALIADKNKGIANIAYDNLGYPKEIQFSNGNKTRYVYLPDGTKLKTTHITAVDGIVVPLSNTVELADYQIINRDSTEYFGNIIYENGIVKRYIYDGGYVSVAYYSPSDVSYLSYHHYVKDHLGNIRAVVSDNGHVEQTTHYYPSGAIMSDISTNQSLQPNKYNGKELDRMHGLDWYDYGARNYDAQILTWDRMDPLCEKYYNVSPYVYCMNNPVMFIDPDGKRITRGTVAVNERGKPILTYGETTANFIKAMHIFAETSYGRKVLSSFTEQGRSNYGVKGNGKYGNIELSLRMFQFKSEAEHFAILGNINGSFGIEQDEDSRKIKFNINIVNSGRSVGEMLETIVHEFCLHGEEMEKLIDIDNKKGYNAAKKEYDKDPEGQQDHMDLKTQNKKNKGVCNFLSTKDEIIKKHPEFASFFE